MYDVTTEYQTTQLPEYLELLCCVGAKNNVQVFGGKSFIIPRGDNPERNIISTGELLNGTGVVVSNKGVYLRWSSQYVLTYKAFDIVESYSILLQLYYR